IYCLHASCRDVVERANHELRSAIGKAKFSSEATPGNRWRPSPAEKKRLREREAYQRLKLRAEKSLPQILEAFATQPAEFFDESPARLLNDPAKDWQLLLRLFEPVDVVWIGDTKDSCDDKADDRRKEHCRGHFRP